MYRSKYPDDPGMHNAAILSTRGNTVLPSSYSRRMDSTFVERVSNSFTGSLLGLGLVVMGLFIILLNEGMAAHVSWRLEESLRSIVPLDTSEVIFTENNNKLVHITGKLRTNEPLVDAQFGVSVHAVKLRRYVQMYQWVEHRRMSENTDEQDPQYIYTKEWRSDLIDSDTFANPTRHANKKEMIVHGTTFVAVRAYIGNFQLKEPLKEKIENFNAYVVNHPAPDSKIKLYNGFFYSSVDPSRPLVGDVRVTFSYAGVSGPQGSPLGPPSQVSIIAKQLGAILTSYIDLNGESRQMLQMGLRSPEDMLKSEFNLNTSVPWSLRIGGWLMMFLGFSFMRLLTFYFMDLVPALRKIAAFGLMNFNLCLSFSMALFVMSLFYFVTRPFQALSMMTVSLLPIIILFVRQKLSRKDNLKV